MSTLSRGLCNIPTPYGHCSDTFKKTCSVTNEITMSWIENLEILLTFSTLVVLLTSVPWLSGVVGMTRLVRSDWLGLPFYFLLSVWFVFL